MSKSKLRLPPILLRIAGTTKLMLESRAKKAERLGRCLILDGVVHFMDHPTDWGYESAPGFVRLAGRQSGRYGPTTIQGIR